MRRRNRIFASLISLALATGSLTAQPDGPLTQPAEYKIRSGSSFSASGGAVHPWWGERGERPSPLAADIGEAEWIIANHHISGRDDMAPVFTKAAIRGMLRALDPHSNFHDSTEWKELNDEQRSEYTGIGITISDFEIDGTVDTYIIATFSGSPAATARLRFGDRILAVNGERMNGRSSEHVRNEIRGGKGHTVQLTIERADTLAVDTLDIPKNRVPTPSVPNAFMVRPAVGYVDLSEGFAYTTAGELRSSLARLKRSGMRALVLDLRGNGGGVVDQAVKVAETFLPAGAKILTQRGRLRGDNREWTSMNPLPESMPLVVLVNRETASSSEIVAGALQDEDRALIVGERTFGKGLVQSVISLPGGTGLTLTTGRYFTPSGRSIQRDYLISERYDYFRNLTRAAAIDRPFVEARTLTNRKVFGGDGIKPDEEVKGEEISPAQAALLDPLFLFTREAINGRVSGFAHGKRVYSTTAGAEVAPDILHQFAAFSRTRFDSQTVASLEKESAFVNVRLRHYLAMASAGLASSTRVLIEADPQIARAIEALPRAAALAHTAARAARRRR